MEEKEKCKTSREGKEPRKDMIEGEISSTQICNKEVFRIKVDKFKGLRETK